MKHTIPKRINSKRKKTPPDPKSAVEQLAGSLKTSVPYTDYTVVRKIVARELAKRYRV